MKELEQSVTIFRETRRKSNRAVAFLRLLRSWALKGQITSLEMVECMIIAVFSLSISFYILTTWPKLEPPPDKEYYSYLIPCLLIAMGISGMMYQIMKLNSVRKTVFCLVFWLIPSVFSLILIVQKHFNRILLVSFLHMSVFWVIFAVNRWLKSLKLRKLILFLMRIGFISAFYGGYIYLLNSYLNSDLSEDFMIDFELFYITYIYILILTFCWIRVHVRAFKSFPRQEETIVREIYQDIKYDMQAVIQCNALVTDKDCFYYMNKRVRYFLSVILYTMMITCVIFSFQILRNLSLSHDDFAAAVFFILAIPICMMTGLVFAASSLRTDDKVTVTTVLGGISCCVSIPLSIFLDENNYHKMAFIARIEVPIAYMFWILMSILFSYNKRCFQKTYVLVCTLFFLPFGFLSLLYDDDLPLVFILEIVCALVYLGTWTVEFLVRIKTFIMIFHKRKTNWYEMADFLCSTGFLLSLSLLVYYYFEAQEYNYRRGILLSSICSISFTILATLFVQRSVFYTHRTNDPTLPEIIKGTAEIANNEAEKKLLRNNRICQFILILLGGGLVVAIGIFSAVLDDGEFSSVASLHFLICTACILVFTIILLMIKGFLLNFGKQYVALICGCCWFFVILPVLVIVPIVLSFMDDDKKEELSEFSSWVIGIIFLLILGGVSILSISINNILSILDQEKKLILYSKDVNTVVQSHGINSELEVMKVIYKNFERLGEKNSKELLNSESVVKMIEPENLCKKIVFVKESEKASRRLSRKFTNISVSKKSMMSYAEKQEDEKEGQSLLAILQNLFKKKEVEPVLYPDTPMNSSIEEMDEMIEGKIEKEVQEYFLSKSEVAIIKKTDHFEIFQKHEELRKQWLHEVYHFFSRSVSKHTNFPIWSLEDYFYFLRVSGLIELARENEFTSIFGKEGKTYISVSEFSTLLKDLSSLIYNDPEAELDLIFNVIYPHLITAIPSLKKMFLVQKTHLDWVIVELELDPVEIESSDLCKFECCDNFLNSFTKIGECFAKCLGNCLLWASLCIIPTKEKSDRRESSIASRRMDTWREVVDLIVEKFSDLSQGGRSKDFVNFECNINNIGGIFEVLIEMIFLSAIAFKEDSVWGEAPSHIGAFLLSEGEENYLIMFICSAASILIYIVVACAINRKLRRGDLGRGENEIRVTAKSCQFWLEKLATIFGKILYFSIMTTVLTGLACKYYEGKWVMMNYEEQECFADIHYVYFSISIVGLLFYYPIATMLYPSIENQKSNNDLKFNSSFLIIESQLKLFLAAIAVFFEAYYGLQLIITSIVCAILSAVTFKTSPCIVDAFNFLKGMSFLVPMWFCVCSLLKIAYIDDSYMLWVMVGGIFVMVSAVITAYIILFRKFRRINAII